MKTIKYFLSFLILGTILTACSEDNNNLNSKKQIGVIIQQVKLNNSTEQITFSGTIEEAKSSSLSFSVMGTVDKVYFEEGQAVNKGTLLAEINSETYKNAYQIALSSVNQAEDAYKRLEPMYKNGTYPEIKMVELETQLQQAKANLEIVKKNLNDCKLYANMTGIVGRRLIDPGSNVIPGSPIFTIVDINTVFAKVPVPENEIGKIKKGGKAAVQINAVNENYITGTIEEIGVLANPLSHTYDIKIRLANPTKSLKPGMVCNVQIDGIDKQGCLLVPSSAVQVDENGLNFVYLVNENKSQANKHSVTVGTFTKNDLEILSGLKKDDIIVISGFHKLYDNAPIEVIKYTNY